MTAAVESSIEPTRPAREPLESGDVLTAREFIRRYEAMPEVKKAELIEGVVYMGPPVRQIHAAPDSLIQAWLVTYASQTPGTEAAANATLLLDADNVAQPDALLRILPEFGGNCRTNDEGFLQGAPELIAEIAASHVSRDLHDKLRVYRRSGVREYLVWRTVEQQFDWWRLEDDEYRLVTPDAGGLVHSQVFPGLVLELPALLAMNVRRVLEVLARGLAGAEHQAFVSRLAERQR